MVQTLRILHILRAPLGGAFRHVRDLALDQAKWGLEVGVVIDAKSSEGGVARGLDEFESQLPLGLHRISMTRSAGVADLVCIRETHRLICDLGIDIVHGHGARGGLYARVAGSLRTARSTARPLRFYSPHGGGLQRFDGSLAGNVFASAEARLVPMTDGLIFDSAHERGIFDKAVGLADVPYRIIPHGLSDSDFHGRELKHDAASFVLVGDLKQAEGGDVLLDALRRLKTPERLVVVGEGPHVDRLRAQSHRLGLGARVKFVGEIPNREAFTLGKVLVMPSRTGSLPYLALEAAAAGVPLIATNAGGMPEIVEGSDTRLVPGAEPEALACAMAHAIDDFSASVERAERLRHLVVQRFTKERMTRSVMEFYRDGLLRRQVKGRVPVPRTGNIYYGARNS